MPTELLLLVLAWAATLALIVILPWAVIRLSVGILEADVSELRVDHERAQPRHAPDAEAVPALSRESDTGEPAEPVSATATPDEDADR